MRTDGFNVLNFHEVHRGMTLNEVPFIVYCVDYFME